MYTSKFLVVATGENNEVFILDLIGIDSSKEETANSLQVRQELQR